MKLLQFLRHRPLRWSIYLILTAQALLVYSDQANDEMAAELGMGLIGYAIFLFFAWRENDELS